MKWTGILQRYLLVVSSSKRILTFITLVNSPLLNLETENDSNTMTENVEGHNDKANIPIIPNVAVAIPPDTLDPVRQPYITKPDGAHVS